MNRVNGTVHRASPVGETLSECRIDTSLGSVPTEPQLAELWLCSTCFPIPHSGTLEAVRRGMVITQWRAGAWRTYIEGRVQGGTRHDVSEEVRDLYRLGYIGVNSTGYWGLTALGERRV